MALYSEFGAGGMTKSFQIPAMTEMTLCSWVKLSRSARDQSHTSSRKINVIAHFTTGNQSADNRLFHISLRSSEIQGIFVELDTRIYVAEMNKTQFQNLYGVWHSICISWDMKTWQVMDFYLDGIIMLS